MVAVAEPVHRSQDSGAPLVKAELVDVAHRVAVGLEGAPIVVAHAEGRLVNVETALGVVGVVSLEIVRALRGQKVACVQLRLRRSGGRGQRGFAAAGRGGPVRLPC